MLRGENSQIIAEAITPLGWTWLVTFKHIVHTSSKIQWSSPLFSILLKSQDVIRGLRELNIADDDWVIMSNNNDIMFRNEKDALACFLRFQTP
jgi:hypothetical protein